MLQEKAQKHLRGFSEFIREQGVIALAIGFILGGAISKVVTSFVKDIVNPILGVILGSAQGLSKASTTIGNTQIMWGSFLSALIDFAVLAFIVYIGVKIIGIDRLDKKKKK